MKMHKSCFLLLESGSEMRGFLSYSPETGIVLSNPTSCIAYVGILFEFIMLFVLDGSYLSSKMSIQKNFEPGK